MRDDLEQYLLKGAEIGMPIVNHCGFEIAHGVRMLHPHRHRGPEIVFLLQGEMNWDFSDGKSLLQRGGMMHFLKSGVSHSPRKSRQTPCHQAWIVLNPLCGSPLEGTVFRPGEIKAIHERISELSGTTDSMDGKLAGDIAEFSSLCRSFKTAPERMLAARIRALVCKLLIEAVEPPRKRKADSNSDSEAVRMAKEYLEKNISRPVEMEALSRRLGYSGAWMLKIFRNSVGVPPAQYLRRRRVEKAQELLLDGRLSITDIAFKCGFNSSQHFSQVFRKYAGQTPRQARQANAPVKT